jgi:hypothetical protein
MQSVTDLRHAFVVLKRWLRRRAPVTHQDQGLAYRARGSLRLPLAGNAGPRKPFVPRRVDIRRSPRAIVQLRVQSVAGTDREALRGPTDKAMKIVEHRFGEATTV